MTTRFPLSSHATADNIRNEFDRVVDRVMAPAMAFSMGLIDNLGLRSVPSLNIIERDDTLIIEAELPGLKQHQLTITITDDVLTISGHRTVSTIDQDDEVTMLRRERHDMKFERSVQLPEAVEYDKLDAVLADGVLTITMPKVKRACTRRIDVRN
jgi:HSP20 family protein